jgi:hypothetical protein
LAPFIILVTAGAPLEIGVGQVAVVKFGALKVYVQERLGQNCSRKDDPIKLRPIRFVVEHNDGAPKVSLAACISIK